MKKFIILIFSSVFLLSNAIANDAFLDEFNEWLSKNGHYNYLNDPDAVVPKVCKEEKRFSHLWYYNKCDEIKSGNNLDINFFKSAEIPWGTKPNRDTLLYYLFRYLEVENQNDRAGSKGSKNPYKFEISLRADDDKTLKKVRKAMNTTSILSYLLYEDGKITIDEISPKDRFGIMSVSYTHLTLPTKRIV